MGQLAASVSPTVFSKVLTVSVARRQSTVSEESETARAAKEKMLRLQKYLLPSCHQSATAKETYAVLIPDYGKWELP